MRLTCMLANPLLFPLPLPSLRVTLLHPLCRRLWATSFLTCPHLALLQILATTQMLALLSLGPTLALQHFLVLCSWPLYACTTIEIYAIPPAIFSASFIAHEEMLSYCKYPPMFCY